MATSLVLLLQVHRCHLIRHVCLFGATLRHACLYSATLSDMHAGFIYSDACVLKCFSIRQEIGYVTNPPDTPTGKVCLPRVCKTYQLPAWMPSWIYQILGDALAASLGCCTDDVCNSRISKISILNAKPWSLSVSGNFLYIFL